MKILMKALVGVAGIALTMSVTAGVAETKHNLGIYGTGSNHLSTGTAEICVFCHTPHAAVDQEGVPLWNKSITSTSNFIAYASSTIDGDQLAVGSVSVACLSCHDGSQAMDVVINAPGSGLGTGRLATDGDWTGSATMTGIAALTTDAADLANDHPIGVEYGGGLVDPAAVAPTTTDKDFVAPATTEINGIDVWWVNVDADSAPLNAALPGSPLAGVDDATREKTDMILYNRTNNSSEVVPFVECASCHDPHTSTNATFLRISNDGSEVCLACHVK